MKWSESDVDSMNCTPLRDVLVFDLFSDGSVNLAQSRPLALVTEFDLTAQNLERLKKRLKELPQDLEWHPTISVLQAPLSINDELDLQSKVEDLKKCWGVRFIAKRVGDEEVSTPLQLAHLIQTYLDAFNECSSAKDHVMEPESPEKRWNQLFNNPLSRGDASSDVELPDEKRIWPKEVDHPIDRLFQWYRDPSSVNPPGELEHE